MKLLQNKSTGEIGCLECLFEKTPEKITVVEYIDGRRGSKVWYYDTLAELDAKWEDYEEPEGWCVTMYGGISRITKSDEILIPDLKEIGNYFNDKESAYDALDKLKAYKRLRDKGLFLELDIFRGCIDYRIDLTPFRDEEIRGIVEDLELLFREER